MEVYQWQIKQSAVKTVTPISFSPKASKLSIKKRDLIMNLRDAQPVEKQENNKETVVEAVIEMVDLIKNGKKGRVYALPLIYSSVYCF